MSVSYDDQVSYNVNVIQQSISVRDRIILDDESTETLVYMVNCAKNVLSSNYNYYTMRRMMHELLNVIIDEEDYMPILSTFLCGMGEEEVDPNSNKKRERLVDKFIDELLRFLAMKILLATNNTKEEYPIYNYDENDDDNTNRERIRCKCYQLNPSIMIRESWKALLMLPHTYVDVCKALGISTPIDYDDDEDDGFRGEASTSQWGRECYRWTLQTYANLYVVGPPKMFWPELEPHVNMPNVSVVTEMVTKVATALQNMDRKNAAENYKRTNKNITGI
mmetsp:Transcript_21950/g.32873  ORF Transcript_21950/g.32873 Transcript_21950/m.32873 type:complete len:278 (-) Transcript_21950:139-972(-)|eukprot:CAMPEP_0203671974 /NCGR_PEP_ID=MMETSP0090-20130426/7619_1 /ASSEMBLY_ACC=CAM_ASM_001088 /TAXON_ID=426623 /ORGANISM="Chaetoceros affinis, Strain CCMP159" /LENGTH=277 /DNA_ID=CAMNT_0050537181 /DNA_START=180 /DNA_END=1013 /DNA_ORIENTATION=-